MARERRDWVLLLLGFIGLGCCTIFTRAHTPYQLTKGQVCRQHAPRRDSPCAWVKIGSFELLTAEELKEEMLGPIASKGEGSPLEHEETAAVTAANASIITAPTSRVQLLAVRLEWVSRELGKVAEGGGTTLRMWASQSLEMGKKGAVWFQERWRVKLVYCALAVYGVRVTGGVAIRIYAALRSAGSSSSSDVILDADDRALGSRGAILDVEGLALLVNLGAVGHLPPASPVRSRSADAELEEEDHGWRAVEGEIRRAIGLRCNGGRRGQYAEELARALRRLEEARDNADFEALGSQRASLSEQAVLLIQARLCDAYLRSLRDGLVLSASDLSTLSAFWDDQKSNHRRMGVVKSVVLGRLHGKVFGKRATLEKDQEKISSCELLLEAHLRRLGAVQSHLQARPKVSMEAVTPTSGGAFTEAAMMSLEAWVDAGVEMLLRELEELEMALQTVSDVTMSSQRQRRLVNGLGKDAMVMDSTFDDDKDGTEALPEHPWHPPNATVAVSGAGTEGAAEDAQARVDDPVTSGLRAGACLHLPVARLFEMPPMKGVAVTMLRAGWDCGANSSSNSNFGSCLSPSAECNTPERVSQDALSGPSGAETNFRGTMCGGTTLLKSDPGSGFPAVVLLLRSKPKSKSEDAGGAPERAPPSSGARTMTEARCFDLGTTRPGKEDGGGGAHQPSGRRKGKGAIGESSGSKKKSTLVVDAWKWLTLAESSGQESPARTGASPPAAAKARRRTKCWYDSNQVVGRTTHTSCSRRGTKGGGDATAAEASDGGGGWVKWFASGDFGERRMGAGVDTRPVETGKRSRTKENEAFSAVASPKRLRLIPRASDVVVEGDAKLVGIKNTRRFRVGKASEQEEASGGGRSERLSSIAVKGRGAFAASKEEKARAGAKALEGSDVKLSRGGEGRNRLSDLAGWRWKGRVSSLAAATTRQSRRLLYFPRSRSGDEGKGMVLGVIGDGSSAKAIVVAAAIGVGTAAAVAALTRITGKADSSYSSTDGTNPGTNDSGDFSGTASPFVVNFSVANSSDILKATQQDVRNVDSSTERAGKHVAGQEAESGALPGCDSMDPHRSSTAGKESTNCEEVEAIDYRGECADAIESDALGSRFLVEDRNSTTVGEGDLVLEETPLSRCRQGRTSQGCSRLRLGRSLAQTMSLICRKATATAGKTRAAGMRGVRISSKFGAGCVSFLGVVLTSPVRPALAGIRAICGACTAAVAGMGGCAARFKHRCVQVGRSVGGAASSGYVLATEATCLARGTALRGLVESGRVCAGGAGTVSSAVGRIARYVFVVVDPREFGPRLRFVRLGPLVRLRRWVAKIVAGGCLAIGSSARAVGGTVVRGSVKTTRFCAGVAVLVLPFLPMKAAWAVKKIAMPHPGNVSKPATPDIEQTLAVSGIGQTSPDTTAAAASRFPCSKDAEPFNPTLCQTEDLGLVGFSATNSTAKGNSSTGSNQDSTSGPEDTFLKERDTATRLRFNEKSQTECLPGFSPSFSAIDSLWTDSSSQGPLGLLTRDPNEVVAPKSQAWSSSRNDPLLPSRVSYREKALESLPSNAFTFDVPERSARRSQRLVSGVKRAASIAAASGGSGNSGAAGAGGVGIRTISVARALRTKAAGEAAVMGCARPARNKAVRMAVGSVLAAPATFRFGRYLRQNWTELRRVQAEAAAGLSTFFSEQLWEPCQAIVKQVLFRERQSFLVDRAALEDAETSLRNMLRDFVRDKKNKVPEEIREKVVAAIDMSVVSRKLEKETRGAIRGTVSGKIPRMLLIQGTFLKKELLQAMEGIDELYQANQVTLRLISIVPAALVIVGAYKISTVLLQAAASRRLEPTTLVHRSMRILVRDIERLLTSSSGFAGGQGVDGAAARNRGVLDDEETGRLALCLHTLQTTLRKNSSRFEARARRALEEDLSDMTRGGATVSQQMEIIGRLKRSYPFLRPEGG